MHPIPQTPFQPSPLGPLHQLWVTGSWAEQPISSCTFLPSTVWEPPRRHKVNFNFSVGIWLNSPASIYFSLFSLTIHPLCLCPFPLGTQCPQGALWRFQMARGLFLPAQSHLPEGVPSTFTTTQLPAQQRGRISITHQKDILPQQLQLVHIMKQALRADVSDEHPRPSPGLGVIFS